MIDIHSHILPFIDDGSSSIESTLEMLKDEVNNGVDTIICTPHYMVGVYDKSLEEINKSFEIVKNLIKENNLPLNVLPGMEIAYTNQVELIKLLKNKELLTLNNSPYVLIEFDYNKAPQENILDILYRFEINGFKVIFAHVERYEWLDFESIIDLKENGALIQINASSAVGADGNYFKKLVTKLIKNYLVDFIASDIHSFRKNYLSEALKKWEKYIENPNLFI